MTKSEKMKKYCENKIERGKRAYQLGEEHYAKHIEPVDNMLPEYYYGMGNAYANAANAAQEDNQLSIKRVIK